MILSMTGYGKSTVVFNQRKICAEIKSLNGKVMDLSARIIPLYREKEMEIRSQITQTLERGKVEFNLWIEQEDAQKAASINTSVLEGYVRQIQALSERMKLALPSDWFATLLRLPDVLAKGTEQEVSEEEWKAVKAVTGEAVRNLMDFRCQEGAALERKFQEKIDNISSLLRQVELWEKSRVDKIKERILESLKNNVGAEYDKNRFEQELIYYIEKLDVSEEKQRLINHLKYFCDTMADGRGQGKKLGFISQEMGREINTLGSKSNIAEMQNIVVKMKDELEQIKEQVLNVM